VKRLLVAVDDSADSLAAARLAIDLAMALHGQLRVVHVVADHLLDTTVAATSGLPAVAERRAQSARTVLSRVAAMAHTAGVPVKTDLLSGDTGPVVLETARDWPADVVIVGKSAHATSGEPYVGVNTRHILEFAEQPVIVVPRGGPVSASG
jgi:nucleotide-binding universal stress UspA family protein